MYILGTKVHNITFSNALKKADAFLDDKKQHYIVTSNPEIVLQGFKDRGYRKILNRADLNLPDGTGVVWASKRLHKNNAIKKRIAGVDFMIEFLSYLSYGLDRTYKTDRTYRILFLGGKNGVAKKAAQKLNRKFPHLTFYGIANLKSEHLDFVIKEIIQPHCVFVALGAPKQERWIYNNLKKFPSVKIAMGVGGALDMISGNKPRAPVLMRSRGLEWLWRLLLEPERFRRIFNAAVIFPLLVIRERLKT